VNRIVPDDMILLLALQMSGCPGNSTAIFSATLKFQEAAAIAFAMSIPQGAHLAMSAAGPSHYQRVASGRLVQTPKVTWPNRHQRLIPDPLYILLLCSREKPQLPLRLRLLQRIARECGRAFAGEPLPAIPLSYRW
jgi:hypothetical protein